MEFSKRELLAGLALAGLLSNQKQIETMEEVSLDLSSPDTEFLLAEEAVKYADALLEILKK